MKRLSLKFAVLLFVSVIAACSTARKESVPNNAERIISVGGFLTEIIYALGAENKLVVIDTSNIYPETAKKLAQIGYQ